jgi:hypothetical protein
MSSPWNPRNAITVTELKQATELNTVEEISFVDSPEGWYVIVKLSWRDEDLHLTTLRDKGKPKYYTDMERLFRSFQKEYPSITHGKWYTLSPPTE